jgi:hypothetical protein
MAPGKSQKRRQYKHRQNGRQLLADQPNPPQQSLGQRVPKSTYQTQQRSPAPQSYFQQVSVYPPSTNSDNSNRQRPPQDSTNQQTPRLSALQLIRNFTKEWNPNLHHNHQPFAKLPGDLALCIMDHLKDPVDKISLALTTKSMWEWSQGILKLEDFDLQQVLPVRVSEQRGVIKPWPYFKSYRWRLIERLENEHWKACSGCLRLHPKTEFFHSELKELANERYCRAPGLIQLCPHILLSYKKCATLQKVLADQAEGNKNSHQNTDFNKYLYHECNVRAGASNLIIGTQPFVTDNKQQLVFRQKYILLINSENLKENLKWIEGRSLLPNLCPHRSIITHCLDMLDEKSRWNKDMIAEDNVDEANVTCRQCGTYFSGFRRYVHASSHKFRIEFFTSKLLGKDYVLQECKLGHGIANELQSWIEKTHLANVVDVSDAVHFGCKCRKKCRKLAYEPISCPSPRASLPDTTWKGDVPVWPY